MEGMKNIPDKSIDMILCDLPYGTTANKWDTIIPIEPLWAEYKRIIKDRGVIALTCQMPFTAILGISNLEWLKYEYIWQKTNVTGFLNANKAPLKIHENILIFAAGQPTYNPQLKYNGKKWKGRGSVGNNYKIRENPNNYGDFNDENKSSNPGFKYPNDILKFDYDQDKIHPTQKPVKLFEFLIRTYSNEGEIILDNCMGSGTTAVAAIRNNRHFMGFELDPDYYKQACERVDAEIMHEKTKTSILDCW